jgi:hypothetical protein
MYGIINQAFESLVSERWGNKAWLELCSECGIADPEFVTMECYGDEVTYSLIGAASERFNIEVGELLRLFGHHWVLRTGLERYGSLMKSGGASLREFLINLPSFHNRITLLYPKITPPEFAVSDINDTSLSLHYYSTRMGLATFVVGLVEGLGKMFSVDVAVTPLATADSQAGHDVFHVSWGKND